MSTFEAVGEVMEPVDVARSEEPRRLVVGISGSSGVIYGIRLLEACASDTSVETHLVMTPAARRTIALETGWLPADVERLADVCHRYTDISASISSGSYPVHAMAVVPCSMRTLASVAYSFDDNLLSRAADVALKERRRLVLVTRESPLTLGHLRSMVQATEMGAIVCPPSPAFYSHPATLDDMINHTVARVMDLLGLEPPDAMIHRWTGAAVSADESNR
jgi:flavin prenyltransferase